MARYKERISVIDGKCTGCTLCVKVCPFGAIEMKHKKAVIDYDKCIEMNPNHKEAFCNRGIAKYGLGKEEESCDDFSIAMKFGLSRAIGLYSKYCKKQ